MLKGAQGQWELGTGGYKTCPGSNVFCVQWRSDKYRLSEPDTDTACYGNGHKQWWEW